jgi:hypothetical protein
LRALLAAIPNARRVSDGPGKGVATLRALLAAIPNARRVSDGPGKGVSA